MSLFKKPNRKFRQRITRSDSDEEGIHDEARDKKAKDTCKTLNSKEKNATIQISLNLSAKDSTSQDKKVEDAESSIPTKLLSFHDEVDDEEVFKLKKSNYSRRIAKKMEKERRRRLENLNTNTTLKPFFDLEDENKSEMSKGTSSNDVEDMDVDEDDDLADAKNDPKENPFKDVLRSGVIPDAATIYAMKKHRQKAREMRDVIPLEDNTEKEEDTESRLIREDDNDRSDDDDDEPSRINFTVNTDAVERQKVREAFLSLQENAEEELENEDAAEVERWEREQIRKGVSVAQVSQAQAPPENLYYPYTSLGKEERPLYSGVTNWDSNSLHVQPLCPRPQESFSANLTTSSIKARVEERLSSLRALHQTHQLELDTCCKDMIEASDLMDRLEIEEPEMADNFALFQQMRGYVTDLVECLDMKVAHIEVLTTRIMDLYKTQAKKLVLRRQQDIKDQSDEYSLLSCRILKGGMSESTNERNGYSDETKLRRAAEREGRRMRRRKRREIQISLKHHDGMSTDDEEADVDIIDFSDRKESILLEAKGIFEDVVDEFGSLNGVSSNFEKWKREHPESYNDAFVSLCLPKIFGPFVRIEMLGWNPLEDECNLETKKWFSSLTLYGLIDSVDDDSKENDPDITILPSIVEKILIPKITTFVQDVWDPLSSQQTSKLVNTIKKFTSDYPTINGKSKQVQTLLKATCTRITTTLDEDVFVPMYPKELLENRSLGAYAFFQRQIWSSVKLLENMLSWDGILSEEPLQDMALSLLLNRYIMMGLHSSIHMKDNAEKCKAIVKSFPKSWFTDSKGNRPQPKMKQFSLFVIKYAQTMNSQAKRNQGDEDDFRDMLKDLIQILVNINSLDEAVALAKEFSVKGFKKEK